MSTLETVSESQTPYGTRSAVAPNNVIVLHNVSWETYSALLKDTGDRRHVRLAYNDGDLELMAPAQHHERGNRRLFEFLIVLFEEMGIDCISLGETTFKSDQLECGLEPDDCYYIQSLPCVVDCEKIDLPAHPPDLMIEVDVTNPSLEKLPICAALGVPEHWRLVKGTIEIRILKNGQYELADESLAVPNFPVKQVLGDALNSSRTGGRLGYMGAFRKTVREVLKK